MMITEEEFMLMQEQLQELKEGQQDLLSTLEAEDEVAQQRPLIHSALVSCKGELDSENREFLKCRDSIQAQISEVKNPVQSRSGFLRDMRAQPDRTDETQLASLRSKLDDLVEHLARLGDEEPEVVEQLDSVAGYEQEISACKADLQKRFSEYEIIQPQIETCHGLAMQLEDLDAQVERLQAFRQVQQSRRKRLLNWVTQTEAVNETQQSIHSGLISDSLKLNLDLERTEAECDKVQDQLAAARSEYSEMLLLIADEESEIDKSQSILEQSLEKFGNDQKASEKLISGIEKDLKTLQSEISVYPAAKKRLLQKKSDMVQQLMKRVAIERQNCAAAEPNLALVGELTESVTEQLLEKADLDSEFQFLSDRLKWLQAEAQKKGWMLEEVQRMIIPRDGTQITIVQSLQDLDQLVSDTQVQYDCCVENLQIADFEITGLEDERLTLNGILAEMESEQPG
jgi:chromosome segregation ATPase